ncbi:hypothetical protein RND71_009015 [Anisodus tanguticus]|uniref:Uncharacterized protein n=1 Tax=Anisodus tanguticus TaxID=243964 RepID=A0AAE1VR93_9SOLA|nr:hypothetical protein RND71_009015 [Anisodus tanguticus]
MQSSSSLSTHIRKPSPNIIVPIHESSPSTTDNNYMSLLDKYEIERISKELNHYIQTSSASEKKGHDEQIVRAKRSKGWFKHGMMMCSSRHDIVVESSRVHGNTRLPDKHAPVHGGGDVRFTFVD